MTLRSTIYLLAMLGLSACQPEQETTRIVGQLESDRVEITAEFAEPIVAREVNEGQEVTAGTVLIQQSSDRLKAQISELEAALAQNKARLDELIVGPRKELILAAQANMDGALREFEFRSIELERAESLLARGMASIENRDAARAARDNASARLSFSKAQLQELLTGTTVEQLEQARAAVDQAGARVEQRNIDLQRLSSIAPVDGLVDSLLLETGERPTPGQPLAILLAGKQPYARVYIPEAERVHVAPGMRARVFVDGLETPVDGTVRWVSSEATFTPYFALTEHDRGRLTYLAKIDLQVTGRRLPDGVPVEVEFPGGAAE